jgi:hypothetical protein
MRTFLRPADPAVPTTVSNWWKRIDPLVAAEWAAVLLVALFYAAFKTYAMWLRAGDEHIYFAMAQAVAHGAVPYRDFFFAHPPVHLLVPALIFKLVGFSYGVAFWIAPLACLLAGLALWRLVRRFSPGWVGVLALIFFLFGRTVVQSSSHLTGVNIGLMFLCWGAERLAADKPKTSGILLALSVLTGIYFLPATLGVLFLYLFFRPKAFRWAFGSYLLLGLGVAAIFDLVSRGQFLEQVIWYHRAKGPDMGAGWPTFDSTKGAELFHNWPLFLGAIVGGIASFLALLLLADSRRAGRAKGGAPRKSRTSVPSKAAPAGVGGTLAAALRDRQDGEGGDDAAGAEPGFWQNLSRHPWRAVAALGAAGRAVALPLGAFRRAVVDWSRPAPWAALGIAGACWVAGHWLFLSRLAVVWRYYYAVVFVGASVTAALLVYAIFLGLKGLPRLLAERKHGGAAWSPVVFAVALILAFVFGWRHDLTLGRKYKIWNEDKGDKQADCEARSCAFRCTNDGYVDGVCDVAKGCECLYGWQDSPAGWVPRWLNSALRSTFWGGESIPDGIRYWSLENTLWHESRGAPVEERFLEAARAIGRRACDGDTVFGDSGTAPMLANLAGLRVAGSVFDTNQQRFATGFIDPRETVAQIKADHLRFLVVGNNSWSKDGPIADLIKNDFQRLWPAEGDDAVGTTVYVTKAPGSCE